VGLTGEEVGDVGPGDGPADPVGAEEAAPNVSSRGPVAGGEEADEDGSNTTLALSRSLDGHVKLPNIGHEVLSSITTSETGLALVTSPPKGHEGGERSGMSTTRKPDRSPTSRRARARVDLIQS